MFIEYSRRAEGATDQRGQPISLTQFRTPNFMRKQVLLPIGKQLLLYMQIIST